MKINSVHLASFGKFKNYTLDFSDGFNTIYGENEKGKTTIMNFIRMMFYGTSSKSSDIDKNLRKKYMPFDSDLMAGSISFSHEGVSYTLERVFKASNSGDKLKLINHNTGEIESFSGKNDIGSAFFGLSDSAFEKSVFIGNLSVFPQGDDANGELNSKLSNITTSLDEDVSLESVKSRLLKAKELLMSRSGKIGIYDKARQRLMDTESALREAENKEARILSIQSDISSKQKELESVSNQSARLFELLKNAKMIGLKSSLERFLESYSTINSLEEKIALTSGEKADKAFLEKLKTSYRQFDDAKKELQKLEAELEKATFNLEQLKGSKDADSLSLKEEKKRLEAELEQERADISTLELKLNDGKHSSSNLPIILTVIGGVLAVAGVGLGFIKTFLFTLCPVGLALLIIGLVLNKKSASLSEKETLKNSLETKRLNEAKLLEKIESLGLAINNILIEDATRKALIDTKTAEYLEQKEAVLSAKEAEMAESSRLNNLVSSIKNNSLKNASDTIKLLEETLTLINTEKAKLSVIYEQTGCSSKEEAEARLLKITSDETLKNMSADELETAQKRLRDVSNEKNRISSDIAALNQELKNLLSSGESLSILRIKIEEIKKELARQKAFCDSTDLAMLTLDEAFSELRNSFSHVLEEKTAKIFKSLTGGNYTSVNVSKNFQLGVTAKDSFGTKEWQYLSLGTAGQAYFALRLALANLISQESSPLPVLLDDSFSEYDDTRAMSAMKFLKEQSLNSQIILFTCHSGIADMAKNLDSDIKYL